MAPVMVLVALAIAAFVTAALMRVALSADRILPGADLADVPAPNRGSHVHC